MEKQLDRVAKSYDKAIDFGRKGVNLYRKLPEHITSDRDYPAFQKYTENDAYLVNGSGNPAVKDYLSPGKNMKFIDLGCSLSLMFKGYDKWESVYHGVDISAKTIELLHEFVAKKNISVGSLFHGSIHQTPFGDNSFDIGACIGVVEYYEKDFIVKAIREAHRIMKPDGRFVIDIPDIENPEFRIINLVEVHLGRPFNIDMPPSEFEDTLLNYFEIEKKEMGSCVLYFMRCKK
jgi:SAM-dependent methyltransferase